MRKIFLTLSFIFFVIPIVISQDLPSYIPTDGLVAYYPFNGNANDQSGNGNHGTVNGASLTSDRNGVENSSYLFDNSNISIENQFYNNGYETYTINIWFLTNNPSKTMQCLLNTTPHDGEGIGYNHENALNTFSHGKNSNVSQHLWDIFSSNPFGFQVQENMWYMITIVKNSGNYSYYVNKSLDKTSTTSLTAENQNTGLIFGSTALGSEFLSGKLDDIGIWNRVLSEQEIQNLYTSSSGDILLNGTVSAENNQIKNVADPTHTQDAATKGYVDSNVNSFSGSYNDLTDTPTMYTQAEVDAIISSLQEQIDVLQTATGSGNITDQDGNSYPYLTFGTQTWTTEPAAMETYRDGTVIPQVDSTSDWANLTTGAWCYYENDSSKVKLYNWYAVVGIHDAASLTDVSLRKEFAPEGWHVPSKNELITLIDYFISSGYNYDNTTSFNKIAKAVASKTGWITSTVDGTPGNNSENNNSTGFNLHPHGYRTNTGGFGLSSQAGYFWTVDDARGGNSVGTLLAYNSVSLGYANSPYAATFSKPFGLSVRLVKD